MKPLYGLVDEVVSQEELLPRAKNCLSEWLSNTKPNAVIGTKQHLRSHVKNIFELQNSSEQMEGWMDQWFSAEACESRDQFKANIAKRKKE